MLRAFLTHLSEHEGLERLLTQHALGRRMASRFIAGQWWADALAAVRRLTARGFGVTLDYLGESVHEAAAAEEACKVYLQILDRLAAEKVSSHVSIKLTQLGLAIDEGLACRHVKLIAERAAAHGNFVRIDMEGSPFTEKTLRVFRAVGAPRDVLGVVIQAYLYRAQKDVAELLNDGAQIRLVKGAYNEPPDVAFPRKADVDLNFIHLTEKLLTSGGYHAIATHDERLIEATVNLAVTHSISPTRFEFQMLYGIRRQLQSDLVKRGWRVRVYVPFGRQWYPYFMRRLAERPANVLFLMRNLFQA